MNNESTAWALIFGAWLIASVATLGALFFGEVMQLPTFGYEPLKKLVDDALAATRP